MESRVIQLGKQLKLIIMKLFDYAFILFMCSCCNIMLALLFTEMFRHSDWVENYIKFSIIWIIVNIIICLLTN